MPSEPEVERREDSPRPGPAADGRLGLAAVALLMALMFVGGFVARGTVGPASPEQISPSVGNNEPAPALDDTQLRGGLPSGHPPVGATVTVRPSPSVSGRP